MTVRIHHASALDVDSDGWVVVACVCGWTGGLVRDNETATDSLMDHAFVCGVVAGRASLAEGGESQQ